MKLKKEHSRLENEYKELRKRTRHILNELNFTDSNELPEKLHGDTVGIFLHSLIQYSTERFKKFVPGGIPHLTPDVPFSAKIAALRYLCVMAEIENRDKQNNHENWLFLEKKLADIVRWIRNAPKQNGSGSRTKQLHEKIDELKKHEADNVRIKRQLMLAREKNQSLSDQNKTQKDSIRKLQTMINAFQRAFPDSNDISTNQLTAENAESAYRRHEKAANAYDGSIFQISNIRDISQRKQGLLNQLSENLNSSLHHLNKDDHGKLTGKVKALEIDILKSDQHITTLQKELKTARENIQQLKLTEQDSALTTNTTTNVSSDINKHQQDTNTVELEPQPSWADTGGPQRSLDEIEKLRNNNQNQRKLILELNSEINILRESMLTMGDETLKQEKNKDITKLERLVKECEYCIETLESEVELLRDQMTDEQDKLQHPDIERLNRDIENISSQLHQTIEQYTHANIINKFSTRLLECNNIESIAQLIAETLKSMNISYGFYINCHIDKFEHYSDGKPSAQEQKTLKSHDASGSIGYINEGILFIRPHARLMIKNPPEENAAQAFLEATLDTIVQLIDSKIGHLESQFKLSKHDNELIHTISQVTANLAQIKERHHIQSNDAKSIMVDFTREVEESIKLMNASPAVKAVFDNVISESNQRMDFMLNESKAIDKYTQDIIKILQSTH